jgi:cytochrome c oxidase subunit 3
VAATHSAETHDGLVAHHFEDIEQQRESATLGMWLFLAQEVMFFGGIFAAYLVYRSFYPVSWEESSLHLNLPIGFVNTLFLLCSSLTMALGARAAQVGNRRNLIIFLLLTILFGSIFLGVKAYEYNDKWVNSLVPGLNWDGNQYWMSEGGNHELFFVLYFFASGTHALHMVIGIGILAWLAWAAWKQNRFTKGDYLPVEFTGYYWHFVDIVWVFLFPLLYLIDRFAAGAH